MSNLPEPVDPSSSQSEILLYQTEDKKTRIEVRLEGETVWLSQKQMADLFQKSVPTINEHIANIYEEGELEPASTIRKFRIVQTEGNRQIQRDIERYNLDVIISVGYRVKSIRGTQFRIWATQRLREYMIKGFTLDDQKLMDGGAANPYFDELLERVRAIRASERMFYQKVTDIYATSIDYDESAEITRTFFACVQNDFLTLNDRDILQDAGKVTHALAKELAEKQFDAFAAKRRAFEAQNPVSDFDKQVKRLEQAKQKRKGLP